MIHSFAITERDVDLLGAAGAVRSRRGAIDGADNPFDWKPEYGARIGVMPLGGLASEIRWVEIEPCYVFHEVNAYRDGDEIVHRRLPPRPHVRRRATSARPTLRVHRWRIDTGGAAARASATRSSPTAQLELPTHDRRFSGRQHRYGWFVDSRAASADTSTSPASALIDFQHRRRAASGTPASTATPTRRSSFPAARARARAGCSPSSTTTRRDSSDLVHPRRARRRGAGRSRRSACRGACRTASTRCGCRRSARSVGPRGVLGTCRACHGGSWSCFLPRRHGCYFRARGRAQAQGDLRRRARRPRAPGRRDPRRRALPEPAAGDAARARVVRPRRAARSAPSIASPAIPSRPAAGGSSTSRSSTSARTSSSPTSPAGGASACRASRTRRGSSSLPTGSARRCRRRRRTSTARASCASTRARACVTSGCSTRIARTLEVLALEGGRWMVAEVPRRQRRRARRAVRGDRARLGAALDRLAAAPCGGARSRRARRSQ